MKIAAEHEAVSRGIFEKYESSRLSLILNGRRFRKRSDGYSAKGAAFAPYFRIRARTMARSRAKSSRRFMVSGPILTFAFDASDVGDRRVNSGPAVDGFHDRGSMLEIPTPRPLVSDRSV